MGLLHLYAESDNPRCGMTRQSSKWNWNLVKAELGHVKTSTLLIPLPVSANSAEAYCMAELQ